jgi:peptidyl-prolyl cis-trans isomerase-like 4
MEMGNIQDTIGSQFLITLGNSGDNGLLGVDSFNNDNSIGHDNDATATTKYLSLGTVVEDQNGVLAKLDRSYCDDDGRPYADIRIIRALVISDPYDDPDGMDDLLVTRGVSTDDVPKDYLNYKTTNNSDEEDMLVEGWPLALYSPTYDRPPEEIVPIRIAADDTTLFANAGWDDDNVNNDNDDDEEDEVAKLARLDLQNKQEEEWRKRQDTSRAVVLEMLGDRPTANVEAPDNVLFVCKLNPYTTDEDLELIFARFDSSAAAEIVRDPDTGASLQYAFVEFTSSEACNEAYLKMNNALVDDRRIKVDFSQSVAKVWDRYNKRYRKGDRSGGIDRGYVDGGGRGNGRGRGGRGGGDGRGHLGRGRGNIGGGNSSASRNSNSLRDDGSPSQAHRPNQQKVDRRPPDIDRNEQRKDDVDDFGRSMTQPTTNETRRDRHHSSSRHDGNDSRNRRSREDSRSSSRDTVEERRRRRHNESDSRRRDHSTRRTRSRSGSRSSSSERKTKKHHKHHRHRSHEREKKQHKKQHNHHRRRDDDDYSYDDDRQRKKKHHRSERR